MTSITRFTLAIATLCTFVPAPPASAGCGCDHPPPSFALVMPAFASPGSEITIFPVGGSEFQSGHIYRVDFGGGEVVETDASGVVETAVAGAEVVETIASSSSHLRVLVPESAGENPGPTVLHVQGEGYDHYYSNAAFTALPRAPVVPADGGSFAEWKVFSAVTSDGTLLLPMDVGEVLDAAQFAFHITNFPLAFGGNDVVIYNEDGVDLTLFTLEVDSPNERQWGEYYGWSVEDDKGLYGDYYDPRVLSLVRPEKTSDLLTYWRHEFHTYEAAHADGGTHHVDRNGAHPDGSFHVDHGQLVIAISGVERNPDDPTDVEPLDPGKMEIDLVLTVTPSEGPLPGSEVQETVVQAVADSVYERVRNKVERTLVRVGP